MTHSWKLVNTYTGTDFEPSKIVFSNNGNTIVSGNESYFTAFKFEHSVINNLGGAVESQNLSDPLWTVTSVSLDGQHIARTLENRVKIYTNVSFGTWNGTELYHAPHNDYYGASTSFDATGTNPWITIGAPRGHLHSEPLNADGYVQTYNYSNTSSPQKIGDDIIGNNDKTFGVVVILRGTKALICGRLELGIATYTSNWNYQKINNDSFTYFVGTTSGKTTTVQDINYNIAADGSIARYVNINGPMFINYQPTTPDFYPNHIQTIQPDPINNIIGFKQVDMSNDGNVILTTMEDNGNLNYVRIYRYQGSQFGTTASETITTTLGTISCSRLSGDGKRVIIAGETGTNNIRFLSVYDYTLDTIVTPPENSDTNPDVPTIPSDPSTATPTDPDTVSETASSRISITLIVIIAVVAVLIILIIAGAIFGGYRLFRKR